MITIAYQGIDGSFSHRTAQRVGGGSCRTRGFPTFREVYEAVEKGDADLALMPIENTLAGTIYETLDLMSQGSLHIIGAASTQIRHSLLAIPGTSMQEIRKVLSHPKALAQCVGLFRRNSAMEAVSHYDTAGAAADVSKLKDKTCAAIAHRGAAEIYGLEVLLEDIQDHQENYTRFFLLSKEGKKTGKKWSLCFTLEHRPGSLAEALSLFARENVNLTYIVSRPIVGRPFEYLFYVDLESDNPSFIEELSAKTDSLKILGNYDVLS